MRIKGPGHVVFAAGLAGLGILSLCSGDFAFTWQPVPIWVPWREALAHVSGIFMLLCGIGMLIERAAAPCALAMTAYLLSWVLLLQAPRVAAAPLNVGSWLGLAENLVLTCGACILFALLTNSHERAVRIARFLFAMSCLELGLSHFVFSQITAGMVPAWLPWRLGFAYFTGTCHFATGLAVLFAVVPRLAATLEAIMIGSFVLLVHIPGAIAAPTSRLQWTMVCVAAAQAGAAGIVARSFHNAGAARTIRVYRNPDCDKCARFAAVHRTLDWLNHVEISTAPPSTGALRPGEVVVENLVNGRMLRGAAGIRLICRQIPLYAPLRPLFAIDAFRDYVDREVAGCDVNDNNNACRV